MKTLQIDEKKARQLYKTRSDEFKITLECTFGKDTFENQDVTDRIKTLKDAMREIRRPDTPDFSNVPEDLREYFENQYNAIVITEALNEGWIPDWNNSSERKWRPWFILSPSSFGFGGSYDDYSYAYAGSGSRLCFRTRELSDYAGKQFLDIWKKIQL